ncbi:MAG: DUF4157 domain-containing protein [Myxococcota bacterium]
MRLLERLRAQRRAPDVLERIIAGWLRESGAGAHDIAVIGRAAGLWQGPPSPTGVARLERMARPVAPWSGATTLVAPRPALARDESWFAALRLAAVDVSLPSGFVPQPTRPAEATPLAPRAPGVYLALADGAGEAAQLVDTARARTLLGGGAPLEARLARRLRPILAAQGHALDLTTIRIHTGPAADALARELGARAFALGPDLVFADGMFAPERGDGLARLVHELTHTWQQAIGRAEPGRVAALEAEARHAASHLDAGRDGPAEAPRRRGSRR